MSLGCLWGKEEAFGAPGPLQGSDHVSGGNFPCTCWGGGNGEEKPQQGFAGCPPTFNPLFRFLTKPMWTLGQPHYTYTHTRMHARAHTYRALFKN